MKVDISLNHQPFGRPHVILMSFYFAGKDVAVGVVISDMTGRIRRVARDIGPYHGNASRFLQGVNHIVINNLHRFYITSLSFGCIPIRN